MTDFVYEVIDSDFKNDCRVLVESLLYGSLNAFENKPEATELTGLLSDDGTRTAALEVCVFTSAGDKGSRFSTRAVHSAWFHEYDQQIKNASAEGEKVLPLVKSLCVSTQQQRNVSCNGSTFQPTTTIAKERYGGDWQML